MTTDETTTEPDDDNAIFKGLKFFLSGRLTNLQEETLVKHGGEKIEYFSDYVKICIVGEDPLETDLTDAKEIYEVPAVRQDWVTCSLHMKKQLDPKPFEIDNILLKDVVLHCTGLCEEDMFTVLSMLFINGGAFEKDLHSEEVTHLICSAASGPKYEYVLVNRPNIHLVTPDWLISTVERKQLQLEAEFHPRLLIVPKPPPSPKPHQDLGDLSSITGFDDVGLPAEGEPPLGSGPEHPNLQQLKQRFPWMSPSSPSHSPIPSQSQQVSGTASGPPVATATSMSSIMSQLRPSAQPTTSAHQQIIMTSAGQGGGLPSQLKVAAPGGLSQLTDPMQQRIYVQQHLSQQQKQLLQQKQQQLLQQQQQQQQGLHLNVQWSRTHSDGVIQQQRQVLQSGQIIQRGQQIVTQGSQQILQQQGGQQILTQGSQQIIQQGQQILHQQSGSGGQIIQQTQQIIQQTS
ncbi:hypothetical protein WDU94_010466, partial [Cyamophila willieti]